MKIFLSGGEKGSHRNLLTSNNVTHIAVNVTQLQVPKTKEFDIHEVYKGAEVLVYTSENDEDIFRYEDFLRTYIDSISFVIGTPGMDGDWMGDKYIPLWKDINDLERLAHLCQRYGRVAIPDKAVTQKTLPRIRTLSQRWNARLFGITSKVDVIEALPWDTVIVSSWTSAIRYGETQVWDGHSMRRYPAQQKESARRKHRADIIRLGVDINEVLEDSVTAVGTLAIRSWQQYHLRDSPAYDPLSASDEEEFEHLNSGDLSVISPETHNGVLTDSSSTPSVIAPISRRHASEQQLLPVVGIENVVVAGTYSGSEQGEHIEVAPEEVPVIRHSSESVRQCNNCYLASRCPAFKENSYCGYNLPVAIRTKEQLVAALQAMIEMQTSRVLFARFAEELEGQGIDPALSSEVDRLFNLIDKLKNFTDNRDTFRLEVEARSGSGVLSRIFGARAGEAVRQLPNGGLNETETDTFVNKFIDL